MFGATNVWQMAMQGEESVFRIAGVPEHIEGLATEQGVVRQR